MNTTLFFLRSSEQKITSNILPYALGIDPLPDMSQFDFYTRAYGLKGTDIGIYALTNNEVSGAAWIRLYSESDGTPAYIDDKTPVLTLGVMPEHRGNGIATLIMDQLLQEAAIKYDQICVSVQPQSRAVSFYKRLGFFLPVDLEQKNIITMIKKLDKKEITRPTDGYDPRRWMD